MTEPKLFEEMLSTYPAEKRELARQVCQRFAEGDSTQFFSQLLLVLDVFAHYTERIPSRMIAANADVMATVLDVREEIGLMARTIETRDVNITNNTAKTNELCKVTQAKCNETIARVELLVKNLGAHMDVKAVVQSIQAALDKGIKAEIIAPFIQHCTQLEKEVLPTLQEIKEASSQARILWRERIWQTAWANAFSVTFMIFGLAIAGIYSFLEQRAEHKLAERITEVSHLMDYNQEAFRQLAIAHIPIRVNRVGNGDTITPQGFAVVVQDAYSAEMQDMDGHHNGVSFVTSAITERHIQRVQAQLDKLTQTTNGKSK
jgi:hypothetical protein